MNSHHIYRFFVTSFLRMTFEARPLLREGETVEPPAPFPDCFVAALLAMTFEARAENL